MADGDERVRPWRWPGRWFRDEGFWRDIASRTVSGLLVILVGYLYAVLSGYVRRPNIRPVVVTALAFILFISLYIAKTWKSIRTLPRWQGIPAIGSFVLLAGLVAWLFVLHFEHS